MTASVNNGRINGGYFPFSDERVFAREFARELINQLSSLSNPLTAVFHNIFSTTMDGSRGSAASMLFPLLALGMMSSDMTAPAHSNTKQGSMLDQVKSQEQSLAKFDADAEAALKHRGYEVKKSVDKKKAPQANSAKSLVQEQERLAKQKESLIKRAERAKEKYAGEVDKLATAFTELPKATEERLRDLRSEYKIASSRDKKLAMEINQRLKYTEAMVKAKPDRNIENVDSTVDEIIKLEQNATQYQVSADKNWFNYSGKTNRAKAAQSIREINNKLKFYGITRDSVMVS